MAQPVSVLTAESGKWPVSRCSPAEKAPADPSGDTGPVMLPSFGCRARRVQRVPALMRNARVMGFRSRGWVPMSGGFTPALVSCRGAEKEVNRNRGMSMLASDVLGESRAVPYGASSFVDFFGGSDESDQIGVGTSGS